MRTMPGPYKNVFASVRTLSPRMKQAIRLYQSAVVPTKRAASAAVGFHPSYLSLMSNNNALVQQALAEAGEQVAIDMRRLLHALSVKALAKIEDKMENGGTDAIQLKAAIDLADRGPETTKVQRHQVESWSITPDVAKELAAAMVEGARVKQNYAQLASGSHDATGVATPQND